MNPSSNLRLGFPWVHLFSCFAINTCSLVECNRPWLGGALFQVWGGKKGREQNVLLSSHAFMNRWGGKQVIISARTQWGTAGGWVRAIKVMCFLRKCYWHILTTDASPLCVMLVDWLPSSQSQLFDWIMIGDLGHLDLGSAIFFELCF